MDQYSNTCNQRPWSTTHHQASALAFISTPKSQVAREPPLFAATEFQDCNVVSEKTRDFVCARTLSRLSTPRETSRHQLRGQYQGKDALIECQVRGSGSLNLVCKRESQDARQHSPREWDIHKEEVERLYLMEKMTLKQVMGVLRGKYSFVATERQFKRRIKLWGFDRNIKSHEMEAIIWKKTRRKADEGKESIFVLRGLPVDKAKINRYQKKRKLAASTPAPETLSSLICYTPRAFSTPSPVTSLSEPVAGQKLLLRQNQPGVSESVFLPSSLPDLSKHDHNSIPTTSISSWWSPCSYLPLPGFDFSGSSNRDTHPEPLQKIISRLCMLASASRENIICGEPQPNIDRIDSILAIGLEDASFLNPDSQTSLVASRTASNYEFYIMEPLLLKIDALLNLAQRIEVKAKKPAINSPRGFWDPATSCDFPSATKAYEDFIRWFNTGLLDEDIRFDGHKILSFSRATAIGRVDIITQTKRMRHHQAVFLTEDLHHEPIGHQFEAKAIITPLKSPLLLPQFIFTLGEQTLGGFNSLSTPTLSFRSTQPDDADVFHIVKYGRPRELELMIHKGLASLNDCDTKGRSLLNHALEAINPEMCQYLLGYKVDANEFQLDRFGQLVPLLHCLYSFSSGIREKGRDQRAACYRSMLDAGADPSLIYANTDLGGSLLTSSFAMELWFGSLETLTALMDAGGPFISPDSTGNPELEEPPLLILARSVSTSDYSDIADKILLLIERGANPQVRDNVGDTCLHIILRYKHVRHHGLTEVKLPDLLMLLVTGGADVFATNYYGETVSEVAMKSDYQYIWKQVLEDCGYNAEAVLGFSPIWSSGMNEQQQNVILSQRPKFSLKEYCRCRIHPSSFEQLNGIQEDDYYDSNRNIWHGNEEYYYQLQDFEGIEQRSEPPRSNDCAESTPGAQEEQIRVLDGEDFMDLYSADDFGYTCEDWPKELWNSE